MTERPTLYFNGLIYTMAPRMPRAEAVLVEGDRITAAGPLHQVENAAIGDVERVDLGGGTVVPGFNDCHCHILGIGLGLLQLDVSADAVRSIEDITRVVQAAIPDDAPDQWLVGRGYDQNMLAEARHPTRSDLDEVSPHNPVMLRHTSGHVLTANSAALARAGIGPSTDDPLGGEIERDEHGEPTGLLKEAAMSLLTHAIPPPSTDQGAEAIVRATELMASVGITSATDTATGDGPSVEPELAMYRRGLSSNALRTRILLAPQIAYVAPPRAEGAATPSDFNVGDAPLWLAIGGTKIFSDGAMSTRTAAMREPYADNPNNRGILLWQHATLVDMMRRAHHAGWQIITHALGDRAVEAVLDAYQDAMAGEPAGGRCHRMEHCMVFDEALGTRMLELGIVPVMQPDIFRLGDGYIAALGLDRAQDVIPMDLVHRLGLPAAFSSDAPVVPVDPLLNIRSAIERRTPSGVELGRGHAVSAMEAIRLYTAGGAYATRTHRVKGSLQAGMLADFTVLSRDPATTPIEEWPTLHVTRTVAGGATTYEL